MEFSEPNITLFLFSLPSITWRPFVLYFRLHSLYLIFLSFVPFTSEVASDTAQDNDISSLLLMQFIIDSILLHHLFFLLLHFVFDATLLLLSQLDATLLRLHYHKLQFCC